MRRYLKQKLDPPSIVLAALIGVNLLCAALIYQGFGLTWDEPLFYQYGEAVGYAYSIPARLAPDFDLQKAYGPSAADHKIYGPAYLLIGQAVRRLLGLFIPERLWSLWRLVNFMFFQAGLAVFYVLARRWMTPWAALAAAALMAYQPLLWGMAFINPKDMPFLVFFLFALASGMKMVERLVALEGRVCPDVMQTEPQVKARWRKYQVFLFSLAVLSAVFLGWLYSDANDSTIARLVAYLYSAPSENILRRAVSLIAPLNKDIPLEIYLNRGLGLFFDLQPALGAGAALLGLVSLCLGVLPFFPQRLLRFDRWAGSHFRLPDFKLPPGRNGWQSAWLWLKAVALPGLLLGLLTSIRVIGPLAGLFVVGYFLLRRERRSVWGIALYGVVAAAALYGSWPYLWEAPLARLIEVARHMANNPQILPVLFNGQVHLSNQLPRLYLPQMMTITLTEPVWFIGAAGLGVAFWRWAKRTLEWRSFLWILAWFFLPLAYVLWRRPPMYDGFRHFLFILPPVFILCGLAFEEILRRLAPKWLAALVILAAALPGVWGILTTHPYEYAYYNAMAGGMGGAFRRFETDYWLTCYKELAPQVERLRQDNSAPARVYVLRQPANAGYYLPEGFSALRYEPDAAQLKSGDLLLLTTRANADLIHQPDAPVVLQVEKNGAILCVIKQIP